MKVSTRKVQKPPPPPEIPAAKEVAAKVAEALRASAMKARKATPLLESPTATVAATRAEKKIDASPTKVPKKPQYRAQKAPPPRMRPLPKTPEVARNSNSQAAAVLDESTESDESSSDDSSSENGST